MGQNTQFQSGFQIIVHQQATGMELTGDVAYLIPDAEPRIHACIDLFKLGTMQLEP